MFELSLKMCFAFMSIEKIGSLNIVAENMFHLVNWKFR